MGFRSALRGSMTRLASLLGVMWVFQASCATAQHVPAPERWSGKFETGKDTLAFREYVRSLRFSEDTESGDRQGLMVGRYPDSARYGPVATVLPEVSSNTGSIELLQYGKIIARIQMDSIGAQPYPKLGLLPNATTYWWVRFDARVKEDTGSSLFITVDPSGRILAVSPPTGIHVRREDRHRFYHNLQPLARFLWNPADDGLWGTCNGGCCSKN
jgi:hypothetical protein